MLITPDTVRYEDGKIIADWSVIVKNVRATGLRSKSKRKILKRWKILIHNALTEYLKT